MKKFKLTREFKIGFFGIAMIALLYWGVNFLKGTDIFTSSKHYFAVYDQVNGLQPSAPIVIKGYKVGTIAGMSYDPAHSQNVVVEFAIKGKYKIPKNSKARVFSDGLMGGKAVEIVLGDDKVCLQNGDTLYSEINKDFLELAGSEFEFMKQKAGDVVNELMKTLQNLNVILEENRENLALTMQSTAKTTANINDIMESEKQTLRSIVGNLNSLTSTLNASSGDISRIMTNVGNFSDSLQAAQLPTMVAEATTTLHSLNQTLGKVNEGEGTLGQLVNDRQLYDSLVTATSNLSILLDDLKRNPQRYVQFSVFGKKSKVEH